MELGLEGRIAVVAGASRGIGAAISKALIREGAHVALLARTAEPLNALAKELSGNSGRALPVPVDVTDQASLDGALELIQRELGTPTVLVLSAAALYTPTRLHLVSPEEVRRFLDTDLTSAIHLCQRLLPGMTEARHGRIVALGSVAARTGVAGGTLYAAAKAGLEGLIRGIALDYSRRFVTANVVSVAFADTERLQGRVAGDPEARARLERATATRRIPSPADIADVVTFLCSDRASAITGAVVDATAGGHLNNLW